jgi:hypothetical protein
MKLGVAIPPVKPVKDVMFELAPELALLLNVFQSVELK